MKTLAQLLNEGRPGLGDRFQNGVRPGDKKFSQFMHALRIAGTPGMRAQEMEEDAVAYVRIFDPVGAWSWYITEWDGQSEAFGLVIGIEAELGYMDVGELASVPGPLGIGLELDMHFVPTPISKIREKASLDSNLSL